MFKWATEKPHPVENSKYNDANADQGIRTSLGCQGYPFVPSSSTYMVGTTVQRTAPVTVLDASRCPAPTPGSFYGSKA